MGAIVEPAPAKLVASLVHRDPARLAQALARLEETFGPIDFVSAPMPFDRTHYYDEEMGMPLRRVMVSFRRLLPSQALAEAKIATNRIESALAADDGSRSVNVDPGCLTADAFVLATTKAAAHRPHLGSGIHAETVLLWRRVGFEPLPWTYPDYGSEELRSILTALRARLAFDLTGRITKSALAPWRTAGGGARDKGKPPR